MGYKKSTFDQENSPVSNQEELEYDENQYYQYED